MEPIERLGSGSRGAGPVLGHPAPRLETLEFGGDQPWDDLTVVAARAR